MQNSTHTSPKTLHFLADNAAYRARAAEWFTNPELRPVSAEYDRRETTWPGLLALEIALATHGPSPQRLLDVGCGDGTLLAAAAESSPETELVGIDIDHGAVEQTRERLAGHAHAQTHLADAADVGAHAGFPYGRPDLVLVHLNLGLWSDPLAGLCAIAESLAPGGTCYVVDLARPESEDRSAAGHRVRGRTQLPERPAGCLIRSR